MLFATWVTALNILVFAALVAAVIYLFVLIVRALKKYIVHRQQGDAGGKAGREAHSGRDAEGPPHPLPDDAGVRG